MRLPTKQIRFIRYKTPEVCLRSMWPMLTNKEYREATMGGLDASGKRIEFTHAQEAEGIRHMGMWGWADTKARVVRYWHDGKRSIGELAFLLGHEVGHCLYPRGIPRPRRSRKEIADEEFVDRFGEVSQIVTEHLNRRHP